MIRVAVAMRDEIETIIFLPRENGERFRALCEENGVVFQIMSITRITKQLGPALLYMALSPFEIVRLTLAFRREKVDLVHVSGGSWQFKGVIAARLAGVPSVWHLNDTLMPSWVRRFFKLLSPLTSGFVFASNRSRDYYGGLLSNRHQTVITSVVDIESFSPDVELFGDEDVILQLGVAPVVGIVANVSSIKGLETLIYAAQLIKGRVPSVRFVVIGDIHSNQRAYHFELVSLAQRLGVAKAIEWVGGRDDVRPLLRRMDVYVCSSLAESSPASVWEAMAMARPVVSTRVGDVPLHIVHNESGYLVEIGDHESMAARVIELLNDPNKQMLFGARAREIARRFSPERVAHETASFYRTVLE